MGVDSGFELYDVDCCLFATSIGGVGIRHTNRFEVPNGILHESLTVVGNLIVVASEVLLALVEQAHVDEVVKVRVQSTVFNIFSVFGLHSASNVLAARMVHLIDLNKKIPLRAIQVEPANPTVGFGCTVTVVICVRYVVCRAGFHPRAIRGLHVPTVAPYSLLFTSS